MRKFQTSLLSFSFFCLSSFASNAIFASTAEGIFKMYAPNIVYIENKLNGMGTGFLIRPNVILTNRHVVFGFDPGNNEWNAPKKFYFKNGKHLESYSNIFCSTRVDICFITLNQSVSFGHQPKIAKREIIVGENLFILGHPAGVSVPIISTGIVSSELAAMPGEDVYGKATQYKGFSTTAAISKGSSGSPVISKNGEILGIAVGYMKDSQNLNLVISAEEIKNSLENMITSKKGETLVLAFGFENDLKKATSVNLGKVKSAKGKINQVVVEEKSPQPSLDPDIIRRMLIEHLPGFRYCYQRFLETSSTVISGFLKLDFTIGPSGQVSRAGVISESSLPYPVKKCVIGVLKGITFPEPLGGGTVDVKQPFNFIPKAI